MIYLSDKNRLNNIFWTISKNYEIDITKFEFSPKDFYEAAILGFASQFYDLELINNFIKKFFSRLNNKKELIKIAKLTIENVYYEKIIEDRPGVLDFRKIHQNKEISKTNRRNLILSDELKIGFIRQKHGQYPKIQATLEKMLQEILEFHSDNTLDYIDFIAHMAKKYFHINKKIDLNFKTEYEEFKEQNKKNKKVKKQNKSKFIDAQFLEKYSIESAEFTFYLDGNEDIRVKEDAFAEKPVSEENLYKKVTKKYGSENIPRYISDKIANEISTGIHQDIKLFFPSGKFKTDNSFDEAKLQDNYNDNLTFYNENSLLYKRATRELTSVIKNSLLKDSTTEITKSTSGDVIPKEIWRMKKLNDGNIFKRIKRNDSPDIFVDILLDSSASQHERKEIIATETFIIAEALTNLNIKTRIYSFNNYYNYLVLKKFRDYGDPKYKNKEIFKFSPSGSNRDGLAIKFMRHLLKKELDARRFLIVLSDGFPFDEINVGLIGKSTIPGNDYKDDDAIIDSAKEIMLMKLRNINTFGVFTGEEKEISTIKKIYGNDFAYIDNISRFHKTIGTFLKIFANKIE
ncbi:hypothetical protein [Peptoniphilus olsenii]|uniref:hypothetical protein n=1 Tax=Peptoniphilus olsenii TaxID=411570 RepID=UPI003394CF55